MQHAISFTLADILAAAHTQGRSAAFVSTLAFTLPQEGVYLENVPGDAGGTTCCGITQADFADYCTENNSTVRPVGTITASEVAAVYWRHYWNRLGCDGWQAPVALSMFDAAVNTGVGQAVKFMQRACGVTADGNLGPATQAAEHAYVVAHGGLALANAVIAQRRVFYLALAKDHPEDSQFLFGWLARCTALSAAVAKLAPTH